MSDIHIVSNKINVSKIIDEIDMYPDHWLVDTRLVKLNIFMPVIVPTKRCNPRCNHWKRFLHKKIRILHRIAFDYSNIYYN